MAYTITVQPTDCGAGTTPDLDNVASPPAGAFLLALLVTDSPHAVATPPSGWTQIVVDQEDSSGDTGLSAYWKISSGSEPATYTNFLTFATSETAGGAIVSITGADAGTPLAATPLSEGSSISTAKDTPAITPDTAGSLLVGVFAADPGGARAFTWDVGIDEQLDYITPSGNFAYLTIGTKVWGGSGAESLGGDFTTTGEPTAELILALRPLAGDATKSGSDSGSGGTSTSTLHASEAGTDTGSGGVQSSSLQASFPLTDSGSDVEASSLHATASRTEAGLGTDLVSEAAGYAGTETGSGADVAAVTVPKVGSDAGSGGDSSSTRASLASNEGPAGDDMGALFASLSLADAGAGVEAGAATQSFLVVDTGTAVDEVATSAVLVSVEATTVDEAALLQVIATLADSGIGIEVSERFKVIVIPERITSAIGLNRGGEHSTIGPTRIGASVEVRR